jgi:hypothetical protein
MQISGNIILFKQTTDAGKAQRNSGIIKKYSNEVNIFKNKLSMVLSVFSELRDANQVLPILIFVLKSEITNLKSKGLRGKS